MAIDDEIDAARAAYPDEPKNLLARALQVAGSFSAGAALLSALREVYAEDASLARVLALLNALEKVLRRHEKQIAAIDAKMRLPEFVEGLLVAVSEATRTNNMAKIERFAAVLGNELADPENDWEEAAAFVRDLAELTEQDIEVLRILDEVTGDVFRTYPNLHDPNPFTERIPAVFSAVQKRGMHRDDFYSRCARLSGFGLAIEVQFNNSRMALGDHCFRFTRRGQHLLRLLGSAGSSGGK